MSSFVVAAAAAIVVFGNALYSLYRFQKSSFVSDDQCDEMCMVYSSFIDPLSHTAICLWFHLARSELSSSVLDPWCWIRGVGSVVSDPWCWISCVGSVVSDQLCQIICVGSVVSDQLCRIRGVGSVASDLWCRISCVGSVVSDQLCHIVDASIQLVFSSRCIK